MQTRAGNIIDSIEHSNKQEKWAERKVTEVFRESNLCPDTATRTKFEVMQENRANGAVGSHEVHQNTPMSWSTYHSYKSACIPLAVFAKTEGVHNIYEITPKMVSDFLIKTVDCGVKLVTFEKNCGAIEKFCACINEHNANNGGEVQDFHRVIDDYKDSAREALPASDFTSRAYDSPAEIVSGLADEKMQIVAELQYTCGLRVSDACHITPDMLKGAELTVNSKNGQLHTVTLSTELTGRVQAVMGSEGQFSVNVDKYTYQLKQACNAAGKEWHGTHGFRHTFAQMEMARLTAQGMTYNQALRVVSEEMGHHRPEITEWYLR